MSLNRNKSARDAGYQNIQYLRTSVTFGDTGVPKTIGRLPAGSLIMRALSGVQVNTVFNAGTNNLIDIGTPANDDLYGTSLSGTAVVFVPLDEAVSQRITADTDIIVTVKLSGTAATTGQADAVIAFLPPN